MTMNRPRIARALRITWTAFWGVAAVLLVALWVRSYWWGEVCTKPVSATRTLVLGSYDGWVTVRVTNGNPYGKQFWIKRHSRAEIEKIEAVDRQMGGQVVPSNYKFGFTGDGALRTPYLLPFLFAVLVATAPWLRRSFSLRTLLVAITLVGLGLGTVVWLSR